MLRDAGVPIDRTTSAVELRHAERAANARIWEFGGSAREYLYAHERGSDASGKRPLAEAHRLKDWIFTWLPDTPDDAYDIVAPLKAAGYTHHIAVPVVLPNGMHNGFTFATRAPNGFSDQDVALLRSIFPTLAALQEVLALQRVMREVMRMYVGDEPHLRILSGDVRRGEVLRIRAAILFADMRDFTGLTAHLSEEAATALVNEYYDCIVPAIDERGGEVLKFMGDGILAIFRAGENGDIEACVRAFAAARAGLLKVARRNDTSSSAAALHGRDRAPFRQRRLWQCRVRRAARLHRDRPRRESRLAHRRSVRPAWAKPAPVQSVPEPSVGAGAQKCRIVPTEGSWSAADRVCAGRARARSRDMIAARSGIEQPFGHYRNFRLRAP